MATTTTTHGLPPRIEEILSTNGEDLPILRQSCKSILDCTDRENSNASDVSQVVMRDQALMTKVIKLANSVVYATMTSVTTAFQAVRIVGFDVIRAIAIGAELVEQADERGGNSTELKRLLAQALVSATAAMELEELSRHKNSNLFTSTMLYTLGDLVLAHYVPDVYHRLEVARQTDPTNVSALEREILGIPLKGLATIIAKEWGLPANIIQVIQATPPPMGKTWSSPQEKLVGIVYSANELGRCWLSSPSPFNQSTMRKLIEKTPQSLALPPPTMKTILLNTFTKAAQFAEAVNIDRQFFLPHPQWGKLPPPNPYLGLMTDIAKATKALKQRIEKHGLPPLSQEIDSNLTQVGPKSARQDLFLWLQEFSLQALSTGDANRILRLGAEGLHKAGQFERVVLVLLSPESGMLEPRTSHGTEIKDLVSLFRCPLNSHHLLAAAFRGYEPMKIDNLKAEVQMGRLSENFLKLWGETTCLVGPLIAKGKPVGVILADRGVTKTPITESDYSNFMIVLGQINMNLTRLATPAHPN
jgi:eukaryotic-like serine/threonine-protein kinase